MHPEDDPVLTSLEAVIAAIEVNAEVGRDIMRRAKALRRSRSKGLLWRDIVMQEERPLIVELLRASQERLAMTGAAFRRAEAVALRAEGFTLDQIAALFGVTRPRIIALLRNGAEVEQQESGGGSTSRAGSSS